MKYEFSSAYELSQTELPPELIPGLIDDGLILVAAKEGSGKTFFAIHVGCHIASGISWQGRKVQKGGVFYCLAEGASFFPYRVTTMFDELGVWARDQPFYVMDRSLNLRCRENGDPNDEIQALMTSMALKVEESKADPRLIIFDTLNRYMPGGDENKQQDSGAFINGCEWLQKQFNCAIMLLHHVSKGSGGARGSSVFTGNVDQVLTCSVPKKEILKRPFLWTTKGEFGKRKDRDPIEQWFRAEKKHMTYGMMATYDPEYHNPEDFWVTQWTEDSAGNRIISPTKTETLILTPCDPPEDAESYADAGVPPDNLVLVTELLKLKGPMGVRTMMRETGKHAKTLYKALNALEESGVVSQDFDTKRWQIAPKSSGNPFADGQLG